MQGRWDGDACMVRCYQHPDGLIGAADVGQFRARNLLAYAQAATTILTYLKAATALASL